MCMWSCSHYFVFPERKYHCIIIGEYSLDYTIAKYFIVAYISVTIQLPGNYLLSAIW